MEIKNSKVIITGGTTEIGFETAKLLRSMGAEVVICGRTEEKVNAAAKELDVFGVKADVSIETDVEHLFSFAVEKLGGLDVLINNAGLGFISSLTETSTEDFMRIWETNTKSTFLCGKLAAQYFIRQNSGNIINISSMGAVKGFMNGSAYVSSKAAISGLTMCWQMELRKHNIRVMQVNPSEVITEFAEKIGFVSVDTERKLKGLEIAQVIASMLSISNIAFLPEVNVWATNP